MKFAGWVGGVTLGLGLVGCSPPSTAVFVDLARVEAQVRPSVDRLESVAGAAAKPTVAHTVAGRSARVLPDLRGPTETRVRASIAESQELAYRRLLRRLRDLYANDVRRFEREREEEYSKQLGEGFGGLQLEVRALFEEYAEARAPYLVKLSLSVGHPDPNPNSIPPPPGATPATLRTFNDRKVQRAKLAEIEADYQRKMGALFSRISDALGEAAGRYRLEVEAMRDRLDQQAAEEAARAIPRSARELGLELAVAQDVRLAEVPERVASSPPHRAIPSAREVISARPTDPDLREVLRRELEIWRSLKRYNLVERRYGRDATDEFIAWKNKYEAGRLPNSPLP